MTAQFTRTRSKMEGSLLDCDSHLYMAPETMREVLGEVDGDFVLDFLQDFHGSDVDLAARAGNRDDVWGTKGISALGACNPDDRLVAMDATGIEAALLFPNTALRELRMAGKPSIDACRRYNDYALDWTRRTKGRARAICQINLSDPDAALAELQRIIAGGARGVLLSCATPPGGVSPAHRIWDPFWAALAEADVPAFLHIASGGVVSSAEPDPMLPPRAFADADALRVSFDGRAGGEEAIGPYYILVCHVAPEVFLLTMVMGGVFERHPALRFGIIECGAAWLGPLCERMDQHADLMAKVGITYPLKPSDYVRRNVRVTPFWHEDLVRIIDRYGLSEVYTFNSDYPHIEGSRDPVGKFRKWTDQLGANFERAFYRDNAILLFPGIN